MLNFMGSQVTAHLRVAYPLLSVNIITTSSCDKEIYVYYNLQFSPQYDCNFSITETKNKKFSKWKIRLIQRLSHVLVFWGKLLIIDIETDNNY